MRRALSLAWRGWGRVAPNPLVGAVVLQGDEVVAEGFHGEFGGPHAEVHALLTGTFHSNAHETIGAATILSLSDGRRILRLTNFSTSNGPDVRVYLVAAPDVNDEATVEDAGFIELGVMKGNKGDQNYDVPAAVDLAQYRTVTIWWKRFSVNFGSVPLAAS